jgi:hypothetical protein
MADKRGTIVFSGENPGLTLYKPGTEQVVAAASYWRCVYSNAGEGNALLIWVDPESSGIGSAAPHAIFADNAGVARIVAERFTQHFGTFSAHGFGSMESTWARFFQESDSRWYHRVVANTGESVIELTWWEVADYQMVNRKDYALGPSTWDLATVICPCREATISIDNQPVSGEVRFTAAQGDEQAKSSAFLAFSETWVEK